MIRPLQRHFDKNKQALEKNDLAKTALAELQSIESAESPYGMLHKVAGLVSTVEGVNEAILTEKRSHALQRVDAKIQQLEGEIEKSGIATPELSNRLLRPLQLVKAELETETSISGIYMLQTETAGERLDDGLYELERAVQAEIERRAEAERAAKAKQDQSSETSTSESAQEQSKEPPVTKPKPIVEVAVTSVFNKVSDSVYLESESDVDKFIDALQSELKSAIGSDKRVRIR